MRTPDTFTFVTVVQREVFAAGLLAAGRTVRLFREDCHGFELLMLEAGPREGEGRIAASVKLLKGTR
jgi:methylglyoxal synthase